MPQAHISGSGNVVGALGVALADRIHAAGREASGLGGAAPAALVALHEFAGGRPIEVLAGALRVSHSRAVRVIDRLEADGLARRRPDASDGRVALVELTPAGRRAARRVLAARAAALDASLDGLDEGEVQQLAALAGRVLGTLTTGRLAARGICRLCDAHACGHEDGRCPVTRAADAVEPRA